MTASHPPNPRQALHLYIDPSPYDPQQLLVSPDSNSPASSSARASVGTSSTTPTSGGLEWTMFSVLCMYDFQSDDSSLLSFRKNEILEIVKQENSGWWAAMRRGGEVVGWVPQAFVEPLSDEMAEKLLNVREELRVYDYEAERLYNSAPISRNPQLYDPEPIILSTHRWGDLDVQPSNQRYPLSVRDQTRISPQELRGGGYSLPTETQMRPFPPPSPSTPMPQPPTPPAKDGTPLEPRRGLSSTTTSSRFEPRGPSRGGDQLPLPRVPPVVDIGFQHEHIGKHLNSDMPEAHDSVIKRARPERHELSIGFPDLPIHSDAQRQISLPWYLRPAHSDELDIDADTGNIRVGTTAALVERLTSDPLSKDAIKMAEDTTFRNIFLMTFRTFMSADQLFDMLVDRFRMGHPPEMNSAEFEDWKSKRLFPTRRRVLTIFTMWLEDHRLLEEEPHIAQRLTNFLTSIVAPSPLELPAKLIIQTIERLTFANPKSPIYPNRKTRRARAHKNDLLRLDPTDIAEQLSLLEYRLYAKISPQECITYAKIQTGDVVANLCSFCSTHDKLAGWVKTSILNNEMLSRRADTVDFWIKVAEKCRNLNNFASMSALINALSSTVITRLHLTWAHVGRKSTLDGLLKYNEPTGGFSGYRSLLQNVEGSCVPFVGMFLTDIVHIQDKFEDKGNQICFTARKRWYDAVSAMLRYQPRPYYFAENDSTMNFITTNLRAGASNDTQWYWTRSQELQQSELAHADIRRGLVEAGF
ncbi:ras guanine nucleotide exchange factor domain-containing protein [Infundibulicybe gibba]|nr:ras guanine nucleotide exchange factor domain-containing protein [Infundibulicybe gibba]